MTPKEAADVVERTEPIRLKQGLFQLFDWQHRHHKVLVHVSWYLRKLREPKPPVTVRHQLKVLCNKVGKRVN